MYSVFGEIVYTGSGVVKDTYIVFDGNKITRLSKRPVGKLLGKYPVITPAFIDAHAHIGMERAGEPSAEGEANEHMESILPLPDALDSVQMDDKSFRESVESGVLYSCVLPGSGNIIGGRSAVIRNYGNNSTEAFITRAGIKSAIGYNPISTDSWKGTRPNTRMGAFAILRKKLYDVKLKLKKKKSREQLSADEKILADLIQRKERLRVHGHKEDDIISMLRIVDEFKLKITIEHACDVHHEGVFKELKRRGIPVVYGPVDAFAYKVELKHEDWRNFKYLLSSGVKFGLMSDHPVILQRDLFLQLRWFLRHGLSKRDAISIITKNNAEILGIDKYLGTLQPKKWASFIGWNGDPFSLESYPIAVYGEGNLLYSE